MAAAPTAATVGGVQRAVHDPATPDAFAAAMRAGWDQPDDPGFSTLTGAAARRARAREAAGTRVLAAAGDPKVRANDTFYRYRADTDFLYLVGAAYPGAVVELTEDGDTLYVPDSGGAGTDAYWQDRDRGGLWVGAPPHPASVTAATGLAVRPLDDLDDLAALAEAGVLVAGGVATPDDPGAADAVRQQLAHARLVKDPDELAELAAAVDDTIAAFAQLARELHAGVTEGWLEGTFTRYARHRGGDLGYLPIVGAGAHACVLHWSDNTGVAYPGDLVLVDAGVERPSGYTADLTRTYPTGGTYTPAQRAVVDAVAAAHAAACAAVQPGAPFAAPHDAATAVLIDFLRDAGLVAGSDDEVRETRAHQRYTLHGTSHMLGLDVHDCASAHPDRYRGPLAEGMVLTVEPGLYFQPHDTTVPAGLRGIGVRIEDDLVVTGGGARNLSERLPATPDAVEAWLAGL